MRVAFFENNNIKMNLDIWRLDLDTNLLRISVGRLKTNILSQMVRSHIHKHSERDRTLDKTVMSALKTFYND